MSAKLPYTSRGLYYWPFFMQYKPKLYNFDETVIKEVHRKVKDNPEFREMCEPPKVTAVKSPQPEPERLGATISGTVLWLRKTEHPDVYNVYETQNQSSPVGVAHIPTLAVSRMLRTIFKDLTVTMSVAFSCKFNEKFTKYEPIEKI
jgi:hypothetical protein